MLRIPALFRGKNTISLRYNKAARLDAEGERLYTVNKHALRGMPVAREFEIVSNPQFRNLHVFLVRMLSRTPHIHREMELGYVLRGEAALRYGGAEIRLRARDGYCIQPLEVHEFRAEARDAVILAVQISPRIFDGFLSDPPALRYGGGVELRRAIGDAEIEPPALCHVSVPRAQLSGKAPGLRIRLFCVDCRDTGIADRALPSAALSREAWLPIRRRRERFAAIMDYIDENFRRKLLLGEIARREGLTMPYLSHLFKDTLGMSFQEYLKKRRFEYARSLLLGHAQKPSGHQFGERLFGRALHDPHVRGRIRLFAQGNTAGETPPGKRAEGGRARYGARRSSAPPATRFASCRPRGEEFGFASVSYDRTGGLFRERLLVYNI